MSEESPKTNSPSKSQTIESYSKIIFAFVALFGFLFGVFKYLDAQREQAETRRIEATRPYLERQLKLYTEATQIAARIATADYGTTNGDSDESAPESPLDFLTPKSAKARFWELYWGELALVEDKRVEAAMKKYGEALLADATPKTLQGLSLSLARACRDSLAQSWAVEEWKRPTYESD